MSIFNYFLMTYSIKNGMMKEHYDEDNIHNRMSSS